MKVFTQANKQTYDLLHKVVSEHRTDLLSLGIKFGIRMASIEGDSGGYAVTSHGVPAWAKISLTSPAKRVFQPEDVIVDIDKDRWEVLEEIMRIALVHHELVHINVDKDKEGAYKVESDGRPKLSLLPHDWEVGGFDSIVKRYKDQCLDYTQLVGTVEKVMNLVVEKKDG